MKGLKHLAALGLLAWYGAILWHNAESIHRSDLPRHHHHPDGHHHGLVSIIVDLIQDLQQTQMEFEGNELFFGPDFSFSFRKLVANNFQFKEILPQHYVFNIPFTSGAEEAWYPPPRLIVQLLIFQHTSRGPPTIS